MKGINAIGLMSGSSLDGLDVSLCRYVEKDSGWDYEFLAGETIAFTPVLLDLLSNVRDLDAESLYRLDLDLGRWMGEVVKDFVEQIEHKVDIIGSHGHTVFHNPQMGYSVQIGNGYALAATSGIRVVNDFRSKDVVLGGSGAPLVPIGDKLLFSEYDACLNLGGIANVTVKSQNQIFAWDVCPCNQVLNTLALREGKDYDHDGELARRGNLIIEEVDRWLGNEYYKRSFPKSMSNEWVKAEVLDRLPNLDSADLSYSFCHFVADQISSDLTKFQVDSLLVSGGGAFHPVIIDELKQRFGSQKIIVPEKQVIDFKEAIIFGFMAVLQNMGLNNVLSSVTGASADSCSGTRYNP